MTNLDKKAANAARQAKFRAKARGNGFVQCNLLVPEGALADLQLLAELLRSNPNLTVGPARDQISGKLVALRAPRAVKKAA
jgi:predicted SnoaL-like aldol condensation-catalyzing enzyme